MDLSFRREAHKAGISSQAAFESRKRITSEARAKQKSEAMKQRRQCSTLSMVNDVDVAVLVNDWQFGNQKGALEKIFFSVLPRLSIMSDVQKVVAILSFLDTIASEISVERMLPFMTTFVSLMGIPATCVKACSLLLTLFETSTEECIVHFWSHPDNLFGKITLFFHGSTSQTDQADMVLVLSNALRFHRNDNVQRAMPFLSSLLQSGSVAHARMAAELLSDIASVASFDVLRVMFEADILGYCKSVITAASADASLTPLILSALGIVDSFAQFCDQVDIPSSWVVESGMLDALTVFVFSPYGTDAGYLENVSRIVSNLTISVLPSVLKSARLLDCIIGHLADEDLAPEAREEALAVVTNLIRMPHLDAERAQMLVDWSVFDGLVSALETFAKPHMGLSLEIMDCLDSLMKINPAYASDLAEAGGVATIIGIATNAPEPICDKATHVLMTHFHAILSAR